MRCYWQKNAISFIRKGNWGLGKKSITRLGLFDEKFAGWGWEDAELGYRLAKDHIPFIKDSANINYHLVHPVNKKAIKEEQQNFLYFYNKIKDDPKARRFLKLLNFIKNHFL